MKLKELIKKEYGDNASEFARKMGVSRQRLNHWLKGTRKPTLGLVRKIEKVTDGKVSYKDW
jgi:DNA-binding transcriptional regulator YdaS (Cro superfamily)